ncbi:MAG: Pvc16 family protein, partial [Pseudanabaena sp.]
GSVVSTLADKRILTTEMIRSTCNDSTFPFLLDSDLADQIQQINIVPIDISLEDLSKAWSVFYQVPYVLSIAYRACLVIVEGRENFQRALPIRDASPTGLVPFPASPYIEQVVAQGSRFEPIVIGSVMIIRGRSLLSKTVEIHVGDLVITPTSVQDREITFSLANMSLPQIQAGVQSLQVIHRINSTSSLITNTIASNVMPFVLCPTVVNVTVTLLEAIEEDLRSAVVVVQLDVLVREKQKVVLALNEWTADSPSVYLFDRPPLPQTSSTIEIPITNVKAGEYLVRIRIDGAESRLGVDDYPDSPTYNWYNSPKIAIA